MAKKHSKLDHDIRVAKQRAKVRFGPEQSTIHALVGQAKATRDSDLSSADAAAKSAIHFANKSRKPVAKVFKVARTEADAARSDVESAFGRLGGAADPFRAATSREQAGAHERVALAGANALHELTQRKLEAQAGRQYAKTQVKAEFRKNMGDLGNRLKDLGDRSGAFIAQEAASLAEARAQRMVPTRTARLNIRAHGRETAAKIRADKEKAATKLAADKDLAKYKAGLRPAGGGGLGGSKPASRSETRGFESDFAKALSYANKYAKKGLPRSTARGELIPGVPATKNSQGVPGISNQLALNVALDMAYRGYVTPGHARRMHKAGLRVADIPGLRSSAKAKRQAAGPPY
jgi:hypothetical protein